MTDTVALFRMVCSAAAAPTPDPLSAGRRQNAREALGEMAPKLLAVVEAALRAVDTAADYNTITDAEMAPLHAALMKLLCPRDDAAAPAPPATVAWGEPVRYWSDDRDLDRCNDDLVVLQGGNGDWYVSVVKHGEKFGPAVRFTTSGTPRGFADAPVAVADLWRALAAGKAAT
jgi:hypothetical protein